MAKNMTTTFFRAFLISVMLITFSMIANGQMDEKLKFSFTDSIPGQQPEALNTLPPLDGVRIKIIETATEFIGIRYKHGGESEMGFDCSGFVKYVFSKFGMVLPRNSSEQYKAGKPRKWNELKIGDLVFFKIHRHQISHVGIYMGENRFIHSPRRGKRVCIASLNEKYWKKRFYGAATFFEN
jgi:cell wall-associated NlpC family hydrolase